MAAPIEYPKQVFVSKQETVQKNTSASYSDNPPENTCCSCWCFARKVKRLTKHENALSQHEIDFTKMGRKDGAFEEKK